MDSTLKRCEALVLKALGLVASWSGFGNKPIQRILYDEFKLFCHLRFPFSRMANDDHHPVEWWKSKGSDADVLRSVVQRLSHRRPSSAGIEHIFSIMKLAQGEE